MSRERERAVSEAQSEVNSIKNRLMSIQSDLEGVGIFSKAGSLGTIIGKLEAWQHGFGGPS